MDDVVFGEKDSKFLNEDLDVDYDADEEMTEESEEFKFGRDFETAPEGDTNINIIRHTFDLSKISKINVYNICILVKTTNQILHEIPVFMFQLLKLFY